MNALLVRLLPDSALARRLSYQSVLFAIGEGVFITGNAVFFTQIVGLTAAQVGLGLSIAGLVTFVLSVPAGKLADRVGPKRIWSIGAVAGALLYLTYPWIHGFIGFVAIVCGLALVEAAGGAGRGAYTIDVFPREERVRSLAFMRSALNIGFTLGALIGGLALAMHDDDVIRAVPLFTAAILFVNAWLITRLPDAAHDHPAPPAPPAEVVSAGADEIAPAVERPASTSALRNRGFVLLGLMNGVLGTNQVLLNVVIPLWLVTETDAPRTLLAWLFGTNTVLAVLLQVRAARGSETVDGALRATRLCAISFVLSCVLIMVTADTLSWVTILLIWLGHVTITGAELFQSAAAWGFMAELSDPDRRGEYQGAWRLGNQFTWIIGPAAYTWLAMHWGMSGWMLIAGLAVAASAIAHPAARSAERHLQREVVAVR
ncbi:MFS transporter [Nocardioides sp. Root151]|uniref:MFS transporter n=1 Tax=Nocardioides sp. Root151 TaxID=1736475 RepID=UPI000703612E|nr:MFS transporter [Nocardioides sp. Root151]KQZ75790.1 hypothetical protein ASD66_05540 [Nocardioides sp. Root151]